jgi:hypothetical protein
MVLVCHPHRFVFLKTRKTASTSVEMYLERFCVPEGHPHGSEAVHETVTPAGIIGARLQGRPEGVQWYNHMPAAKVRQRLGEKRFEAYTKLTTVRNPWTRMLSTYLWRNQLGYPTSDAEFGAVRAGFAKFLDDMPIRNDWEIVSIDDRVVIDDFIRFEALNEDLARVCDRLGLSWQEGGVGAAKQLGGHRTSYPIAEYFTAASADRIAKAFRWLLDRFDYSLTVPDRAPGPILLPS